MARMARVVVAGMAHHVTQRGNRRQRTFFRKDDYRAYVELMAEWCGQCRVGVRGYCLMPNHVHLIVVPETEEGLRRAIGEAHRRYTRRVNFREGWRGHLWQGRFASFVMDDRHLMAAMRYVELNPVRAGLVDKPEAYPWSSARAHLAGRDDGLVTVEPMCSMVGDWAGYLALSTDEAEWATLRRHERTGRPLGTPSFVERLEKRLGLTLQKQKTGPKGPRKRN